jgi:hypothetical protein
MYQPSVLVPKPGAALSHSPGFCTCDQCNENRTAASAWLSEAPKVKSPTIGTYFFKHVFERITDRYMTNDDMIDAATKAGVRVDGRGGQAGLCISRRWVTEQSKRAEARDGVVTCC